MKFIILLVLFLFSCTSSAIKNKQPKNILVLEPGVSIKVPDSTLELKIISLNKYLYSKDKKGNWKATDLVRLETKFEGIVSQDDLDSKAKDAIVGNYYLNLVRITPPLSFEDEDTEVDRKVVLALSKIPE